MAKSDNIERKIIIGFIVSAEFIKQVRRIYTPRLIQSSTAKRLATWCIEFYDKYNSAPGRNIEDIYFEKLKKGLPKNLAEEIEQDILPDLNDQYLTEGLNIPWLVEQTRQYFTTQNLKLIQSQIEESLEKGEVLEAENLALNYRPLVKEAGTFVNLSSPEVLDRLKNAFEKSNECLIKYPKALGEFWNEHLIRGGFVAFMASEKKGKTFRLMEMATRAVKQKRKVVFFQAGDMNEEQQLRRFAIHLAKKSDKEKYIGEMYEPVVDCIHSQRGTCDNVMRESDYGPFDDMSEKEIRHEMTIELLKDAYKDNPDYSPCRNCLEFRKHKWGVPWVTRINVKDTLELEEAQRKFSEFFIKNKRNMILSSHPNGTLSVSTIKSLLNTWKKDSGFVPDIIIIDYADLLLCDERIEFRHQQNSIWKSLRNLSQENDCLVISATQADADSYSRDLITAKNFSEDKRKYAHVTAMWGLNQDHTDREKKIGIMRINEIVVREGDFSTTNVVYVLQNLKRGLPYISSYF